MLRRKSDGSGRCEGLLYRKKEGSAHQFLQAQRGPKRKSELSTLVIPKKKLTMH